jgi:hypothetical protein
LCENLDALDEPEAKASLTWIIGEYAERIENADDLISNFLENFIEENAQVKRHNRLVEGYGLTILLLHDDE